MKKIIKIFLCIGIFYFVYHLDFYFFQDTAADCYTATFKQVKWLKQYLREFRWLDREEQTVSIWLEDLKQPLVVEKDDFKIIYDVLPTCLIYVIVYETKDKYFFEIHLKRIVYYALADLSLTRLFSCLKLNFKLN